MNSVCAKGSIWLHRNKHTWYLTERSRVKACCNVISVLLLLLYDRMVDSTLTRHSLVIVCLLWSKFVTFDLRKQELRVLIIILCPVTRRSVCSMARAFIQYDAVGLWQIWWKTEKIPGNIMQFKRTMTDTAQK